MEKEYDDEENFEEDKFADLEGFDGTCPHCGSDEVQEIDRWFGDKNDTFELCPDQLMPPVCRGLVLSRR